MKRLTVLIFFALLAFLVVLYVKRPDIIKDVWLWLVGLSGPIIGLLKRGWEEIKKLVK